VAGTETLGPAASGDAPSAVRRLWQRATRAPAYSATAADLRTFSLAGLELPLRATTAIAVVTFAVLFDFSQVLLPSGTLADGRTPEAMRVIAIERFVLFGVIPLAIVLFAFRDRPSRYGLTLGDWRWGAVLALGGCIVMTPVVLWFAGLPEPGAYYAVSAAPVPEVIVTNAIDLTAAEFAFRGFLMLTLVRVMGPIGVVVAALPFVLAHVGKPPLELFSTLGGGLAYGWLAWRTASITWGSLAHIYILTLVTVAAAETI
jgi:membrane protease YdiL (CAAX protease family)